MNEQPFSRQLVVDVLTAGRAMRVQFAMDCVQQGKARLGPDILEVKAHPVLPALYMCPLNGDPFVYVAKRNTDGTINWDGYTMITFPTVRGSGADKLRARIEATHFLDSLK